MTNIAKQEISFSMQKTYVHIGPRSAVGRYSSTTRTSIHSGGTFAKLTPISRARVDFQASARVSDSN